MARARNIKPGFFTDAELVECEFWERLLFAGLWTLADREGRLEDRAKQIKIHLFPADNVDVESGLATLADHGLIERYEAAGKRYLHIPNFGKHQAPHIKEAPSTIPAPCKHGTPPVQEPDKNEPSRPDSGFRIADSLIADSGLLEDDAPAAQDNVPPAPVRVVALPTKPPQSLPYAAWMAFGEATGLDIKAASPREKGKSLKAAERLLEAEFTVEDIRACSAFLASQTWRTSLLSMATVEAEIGKWNMAGKPKQEKARASPNGKHNNPQDMLDLSEKYRRAGQ